MTSIFRGGKKDLGRFREPRLNKMDKKLRDLISERFYGIKRGEIKVDEKVDISEKKWDSYDKEKVEKMVQEWGKVHKREREFKEKWNSFGWRMRRMWIEDGVGGDWSWREFFGGLLDGWLNFRKF